MLYFVALRGGLANNGTGFVLWTRALGLVLFGRAFRGSFFLVVLFVVRAFGFVLLVVLFVVRSSGSFFWGLVCVFLFDSLKFLEACVARSEVS